MPEAPVLFVKCIPSSSPDYTPRSLRQFALQDWDRSPDHIHSPGIPPARARRTGATSVRFCNTLSCPRWPQRSATFNLATPVCPGIAVTCGAQGLAVAEAVVAASVHRRPMVCVPAATKFRIATAASMVGTISAAFALAAGWVVRLTLRLLGKCHCDTSLVTAYSRRTGGRASYRDPQVIPLDPLRRCCGRLFSRSIGLLVQS